MPTHHGGIPTGSILRHMLNIPAEPRVTIFPKPAFATCKRVLFGACGAAAQACQVSLLSHLRTQCTRLELDVPCA